MSDRLAFHAAVPGRTRSVMLLGPAFVAAIAYVDPGNVAANLTAGAQHGYLLLWVLLPSAPLPAGRRPGVLDPFVDRLHAALTSARPGERA